VAVQETSAPDYIESTGTVRAAESAQLSSQVLAYVTGVTVHEGDHVKKGQVLVTLDDSQLRAGTERASAAVTAADKETSAAEANYNLADATVKRYENLFSKKSVSPQEFDEVKARYQAAQAQLEQAHAGQAQARAALAEARTMQGYTRLVAPFDGEVTDKRVEVGNLAAPGMPLLTVENTRRYRLEANVNEKDIALVRIGMMAPVKIESVTAEPISARVVQIVPAADPASRTFVVKLDLPNLPNLRSGLFGRISLTKGTRDMLLVPRTAVLDRGQLQAVYVIGNDQVATLRYVTLGHEQEKNIEVLSGIESGEKLVADPGQRDLSGKLVKQ
ncbi:MAG TPA: efflux RND transporter periplasmic adaptor subunit, partial [Terriglobales bacterium]|nr:efflux RND transporter periplasmic adaptor subunit [Terriglobales bacterium]